MSLFLFVSGPTIAFSRAPNLYRKTPECTGKDLSVSVSAFFALQPSFMQLVFYQYTIPKEFLSQKYMLNKHSNIKREKVHPSSIFISLKHIISMKYVINVLLKYVGLY